MMWLIIFIISCLVLFWSGSRLVKSLTEMAKYLDWREFTIAFFIVAVAASLPNLFVGINAALQGLPDLSFGEIVGGNMIDMTLAVALAVLISGKDIPVKSRMVQSSAIFTAAIAMLPLALMMDKNLTRFDGAVLLFTFLIYSVWLFSRQEKYKNESIESREEENKNKNKRIIKRFKFFLKDLFSVLYCIAFLLLASFGVVKSAQFFAGYLGLSIPIVGIFIVGLGNAFPETYFAIISALKGKTWLILGDLIGSVIVCATLVLGTVVLISPIKDINMSPFIIARIFLMISAALFLIFIKTGKKITRVEAALLLSLYLIFLFAELAF